MSLSFNTIRTTLLVEYKHVNNMYHKFHQAQKHVIPDNNESKNAVYSSNIKWLESKNEWYDLWYILTVDMTPDDRHKLELEFMNKTSLK